MPDAAYRFLPWSRRGLSAAIPDGGALPARARVDVDVVVGGGVGAVPTSATLHGPGDVVGLDPTVVVRTIPRAGSTNVEPNYLAAVDFDQPELPWAFTPSGVPASGRLKPWLVLVVVRERPGVSLTVPDGARLPVLTIDDDASLELPDLEDSWAWAHVQLLDDGTASSAAATGQALADHPDRTVSRLVCPRRLAPDARWIACLVPAFEAGVRRGFGATPSEGEQAPAWSSPSSVRLPVYFSWTFQTGPQGDFESLARRLKPYEASARIGRVRMHVGEASPFVDLPAGDPQRFLDMDGALQAPAQARQAAEPPVAQPELGDVSPTLRDGLAQVTRVLADAADGTIDNQADPAAGQALGPPVYAGAHARRTTVTDEDDTWFRELNTDPRSRVAAGLGAEVVRRYQEEVMEACWQQVGDVLAIEAALSRARLSLEASLRFNARHLLPMPESRFLQVTAPLASRTLMSGRTLPVAMAPTSFPARATDAAMRRYTAATGRVVSGIARRAARAGRAVAVRAAGERLVSTLAAGRADVDPTRFPTPAVDGLPSALPTADDDGNVRLDRFGVDVVVDKTSAAALRSSLKALTSQQVPPPGELFKTRPDLRVTGMVTGAHVLAARGVAAQQVLVRDDLLADGDRPRLQDVLTGSSSHVIDDLVATAGRLRGDAGFLVETGPTLAVRPLALRAGGQLVVVTDRDRDNIPLAVLSPQLRLTAHEVGELVATLPSGTLAAPTVRRGGRLPPVTVELAPGETSGGLVARPLPDAGGLGPVRDRPGTTVTMPPLATDAGVIARYESAIAELVTRTPAVMQPVVPRLVSFALDQAVSATRQRSDPSTGHPKRLDSRVSLGGHVVSAVLADQTLVPAWRVPRLFDRVMAFPRLDVAAYSYLAAYDSTRFCPGIDEVPPESVTLLETNPRFVAAFMAGLNHETNRELMWRSYPTDGRGTPWQKFWRRLDGGPDVFEMHTWAPRGGHDDLRWQTTEPRSSLVLLVRGDLLRRYPRTMAVAVRAELRGGRRMPSARAEDLRTPVFAGQFDPDVSFFGFSLFSEDLEVGEGWFFGLMEPVTEPRFGFDETVSDPVPSRWTDVAWEQLGVAPGGLLSHAALQARGLAPAPTRADGVAAALYQRPFKLLVHAEHLVAEQ